MDTNLLVMLGRLAGLAALAGILVCLVAGIARLLGNYYLAGLPSALCCRPACRTADWQLCAAARPEPARLTRRAGAIHVGRRRRKAREPHPAGPGARRRRGTLVLLVGGAVPGLLEGAKWFATTICDPLGRCSCACCSSW